jgi:glycosyltransferase involved in cell wall biosynthesis
VLPNPVLTPAFDHLSREPVHHPWFDHGAPPVVLGVGRLQKAKGFPLLIESFAQVARTNECRLMILGEGVERAGLEQLVRKLGLERSVTLPGFVVNPLPYMRRARVFVLASEYEGMPNSLLQAIACGTAVVSTDCESGPREILANGDRGRLVPVGDVKAMTEAIIDALHGGPNPSAEQYVRSNFSLTQTVSSYLEAAGL